MHIKIHMHIAIAIHSNAKGTHCSSLTVHYVYEAKKQI